MRAISMDLRIRVATAVEEASSYVVGKRFSVSSSWVRKLRQRSRAGESLEPRKKGHRSRKVDTEGEASLRQWIGEQPDATIAELCERYLTARQVVVSETTMRETLTRLGLSRKKRRSLQRNARAHVSSSRATAT